MKELERLQFCIQRFDHFYDSTNNKGNVILVLNTFIIGGLSALYPAIIDKVYTTLWVNMSFIVLILIGLAATFFTLSAIVPYLSSKTDSLLYFGSIANLDSHVFQVRSQNISEDDELTDYRSQVHQLSNGLFVKFKKLRIATILISIQFSLFIPFVFILYTNLK